MKEALHGVDVVGPTDVQHASRCARAAAYHQDDPRPDPVSPDAAQRRIGALLAATRPERPALGDWLPAVIAAAAAVGLVIATWLFQDRSVTGYVVIATSLVLLQCSAALVTIHLLEQRRLRRMLEAMGPVPSELGGRLPSLDGPLQDPEWGLEGSVGTVLHLGDHAVPVLVADGPAKAVHPWDAARIGAHLRLLEVRDGTPPEYGLVVHEDGAFRVTYADIRDDVQRLSRRLAGPRSAKRDHNDRTRCVTCPWRAPCPESLA